MGKNQASCFLIHGVEYQMILDFAAAKDDGSGSGDKQNSNMCKDSVKSPPCPSLQYTLSPYHVGKMTQYESAYNSVQPDRWQNLKP